MICAVFLHRWELGPRTQHWQSAGGELRAYDLGLRACFKICRRCGLKRRLDDCAPSDAELVTAALGGQPACCPDCRGREFYEGPSGGASTNYRCANAACGSEFNIAPGLMYERISRPAPLASASLGRLRGSFHEALCPRCHASLTGSSLPPGITQAQLEAMLGTCRRCGWRGCPRNQPPENIYCGLPSCPVHGTAASVVREIERDDNGLITRVVEARRSASVPPVQSAPSRFRRLR